MLIPIFMLVWLGAFSSLEAGGAKETQLWIEGTASHEISDKFTVNGIGGFRWGDEAFRLFFQYGELGLSYSLNKCWSITPSYRQSFRYDGCRWHTGGRPRLALKRKWKWCAFENSWRQLVEYKRLSRDWFYRNRFIASLPGKWVSPFVSEEFFLRRASDLAQNRIETGIFANPSSCLKGMLSYMFRLNKVGVTWYGYHVFRCYFTLSF